MVPAPAPVPTTPASVSPQSWQTVATRQASLFLALGVILFGGLCGYLLQKWRPFFQVEAASASLTIESDPAGAEILADGTRRGTTPLTLAVTPGEYVFELIYDGRRKLLRTVARSGAAVVHHVQFDAPAPVVAPAPAPPPARVPVKAPKPAPVGPAAGWLTVISPVALQVVEGPDIVGTSRSPKIMLPVGRHELRLTNENLGFTTSRTVQLTAGNTATIRIELPTAPLSLNALPWAEAWVDGIRVGETPVGNHLVRIGSHEVVFRHPELGERRQTVTVSLTSPARVSVDMRKPGS